MANIKWTLNVQVQDGPKFALADNLEVEAYDHIKVLVPKSGKVTVDVQPGEADRVRILLIKPEMTPGQPLTGLTYQVNGAGRRIPLDNAQFLIGGALSLLTDAPHTMTFTSARDTPVTVRS